MKKLNYLILGLAGLAVASCSQDDMLKAPQGEGNYNITVQLPADMATRALGDGYTAENLLIAVYDAEDNSFVFQDKATFGHALQTTVSLNLPQKKSYNIAFFAVSEAGEKVYQFNPQAETPNITVQYGEGAYNSADNLADAYDCFYKLHATGEIGSNAVNTTVKLIRPVAQINWGTNDINAAVSQESAFGPNGKYIVSNLTIANAYTQFSLLDGDVMGTPTPQTISGLASPASTPESATWAFPVLPEEYQYIAMQYVLAPYNNGDGGVYDLALDVYNDPNQEAATITNEVVNVNNAPVQANYRTNIYGMLLTNPTEFFVEKSPEWGGNYDPSLELALQRGGSITLGEDMVLNKSFVITNDVNINLNGHTITYDVPGGSQYDDTKEGMFYVTNGANLTITGEGSITEDSEYTLIWVAGGSVTIEGGTFEAPGLAGNIVYVETGTAYIKGGSYKLEGQEIDKLYYYPINCNDTNYKNGTAHIIVTGGTFYNFNPADNIAEGVNNHTSFVAKGYKSVASGTGSDIWFTVMPEEYTPVTSQEDFQSAVSTPNATIFLQAGSYDMPNSPAKGVTFTGTKSSVINVVNMGNSLPKGGYNDVTFSGITIKAPTSGNYYGIQGDNITFEDCDINGMMYGYGNNVTYRNCNWTSANWCAWTYTAQNLVFEGCTFNCEVGKGFNVYNETPGGNWKITYKDCVFNAAKPDDGNTPLDGKAAVMIKVTNTSNTSTFDVTFENCTATGFSTNTNTGYQLWSYQTGAKYKVTVDGEVFTSGN